jgi:hypothetical protein
MGRAEKAMVSVMLLVSWINVQAGHRVKNKIEAMLSRIPSLLNGVRV